MILQVENLNIIKGDFKLGPIDFQMKSGEICCVIGKNGAGKSSLLEAIINPETLDGNINFASKSLQQINPRERAIEISYLAQNASFSWNMKVFDLIKLGRYPLIVSGKTDAEQDIQLTEEIMKTLEITHLKMRDFYTLSGGEKALCMLARALAANPKLLLADEPFNNLDIKNQIAIEKALMKFTQNGGAVLTVVHDLNSAIRLGSKFLLLKYGKMLGFGELNEIINQENLQNTFDIDLEIIKSNNRILVQAK